MFWSFTKGILKVPLVLYLQNLNTTFTARTEKIRLFECLRVQTLFNIFIPELSRRTVVLE